MLGNRFYVGDIVSANTDIPSVSYCCKKGNTGIVKKVVGVNIGVLWKGLSDIHYVNVKYLDKRDIISEGQRLSKIICNSHDLCVRSEQAVSNTIIKMIKGFESLSDIEDSIDDLLTTIKRFEIDRAYCEEE